MMQVYVSVKRKFDITTCNVLSLDPGSNSCGVTLWVNNSFVATKTLRASNSNDTVSNRLRDISKQLEDFLLLYEVTVDILISELSPDALMGAIIGTILATPGVNSMFGVKHTIAVPVWKSFCRNNGASHPDGFHFIKGLDALRSIGFRPLPHDSDDAADSTIIFLAYREKYGKEKSYKRIDRKKK